MLVAATAGCVNHSSDSSADGSQYVIELNDENFTREVIESDLPVLVDMWAPWCGPCMEMKPEIAKCAKQFKGKVKVAELNVDEHPDFGSEYSVAALPTLMVFVDGEVVQTSVGSRSFDDLVAFVETYRNAVGDPADETSNDQ